MTWYILYIWYNLNLLEGFLMDKKKKKILIRGSILAILLLTIVYITFSTGKQEKKEALVVGLEAPDFEVVDLEGNIFRLSDYRGKGVVLNFWGTWCKPCKREFPTMERQYKHFDEQGVKLIAINNDQTDLEVQTYVKNMDMTFQVAIDKTRSILNAYNVVPLPTTILINQEGIVEKVITGEMTEAQIIAHFESIVPD